VFLLYFTLDPESVDVNVHPRKLEVRFRDEKEIFSIISQACSKALETHVLAPVLDGNKTSEYNEERTQQAPLVLHDKPNQESFAVKMREPIAAGTVEQALEFTQQIAGNPTQESYYNVELPFGNSDESASVDQNISAKTESAQDTDVQDSNVSTSHQASSSVGIQRDTTEEIIPLAQMDRSFILCQQGSDLVIVDQHAAHERIRYTEIVDAFEKQLHSVQPLLVPQNLELSHRELALLEQYGQILQTMGFELEPFGGNTIAVNAVPSYAAKLDIQPLIQGLLDDMDHQSTKGDFTLRKERALIYMACRSAVKFGDVLALEEQKELLKKLQRLALPYTCPHGRPTMITLTSDELIKRFGRNYDA
jgi:DNA mismatch repair protein MutL